MVQHLVVNAGVQAIAATLVEIINAAELGVGQVDKDEPFAEFRDLRFETLPPAFGLCALVIVATALRVQYLMGVEPLPISVTTVLPAPVGIHEQARRGRLCPRGALESSGDQPFVPGSSTYQSTTCLLATS